MNNQPENTIRQRSASVVPGGAFADDQLHESALVGIGFPRCGFFASAHTDHDLAVANCFAGFQFDVAGLAVAFVKQAEHRDTLGHRCPQCLAFVLP